MNELLCCVSKMMLILISVCTAPLVLWVGSPAAWPSALSAGWLTETPVVTHNIREKKERKHETDCAAAYWQPTKAKAKERLLWISRIKSRFSFQFKLEKQQSPWKTVMTWERSTNRLPVNLPERCRFKDFKPDPQIALEKHISKFKQLYLVLLQRSNTESVCFGLVETSNSASSKNNLNDGEQRLGY